MLLLLLACTPKAADSAADSAAPATLTAVTFNTGTTEGLPHDAEPDDGYTSEHAALSDAWYGDGLAWLPAVEAAATFFARVQPDVVVFQEIFYSADCVDIPEDARGDFVCEGWAEGDPTVAQLILGEGYQVACHPGKPDKCAAVHERLGRFKDCDTDLCLEGLTGYTVEGCGRGARVARGLIEAVDGEDITLVNVHGSSGLSGEDEACRVAQVEQVFVDLGDGAPGVSGETNLVMGDLNTDPGRFASFDDSAARWGEFVGDDYAFAWVTELGEDAPGSYGGIADIDHVASDRLSGACRIAGLSEGEPAVMHAVYFDHKPVICELLR